MTQPSRLPEIKYGTKNNRKSSPTLLHTLPHPAPILSLRLDDNTLTMPLYRGYDQPDHPQIH